MEEDKKIQTNKTEKVDGMVYLTLDFIYWLFKDLIHASAKAFVQPINERTMGI